MENIKEFFNKHQDKFILTIGAILIAGCSFAAGRLITPKTSQESKPIEVKQEQTTESNNNKTEKQTTTKKEETTEKEEQEEKTQIEKEAEYVGSVEGGTYFLADSKLGQAITKNKKIWFETQEEAEDQGFRPAKDIPTTTKSTSSSKSTSKDDDEEDEEEKTTKTNSSSESSQDCDFVASSRGNKYYNATSSSAKALSESNKVCFSSKQEAEDAGYEPSASLK